MSTRPTQQTYDHRLIRIVQETRDATIATRLGVPRSTAAGWVRRAGSPVVTSPALDATDFELVVQIARLEQRVRRLSTTQIYAAGLSERRRETVMALDFTR